MQCSVILFAVFVFANYSYGASFFYTCGGENGKITLVEVENDTGTVTRHESLNAELPSDPKKLAVSADGNNVVITSEQSQKVAVVQVNPDVQLLATLDVDEATSDVCPWNDFAILAAEHGAFYKINLKNGEIAKTWNARQGLTPSGHKGESILPLPDKSLALVSFQKDSKKGKHLGSRLVVLDLDSFSAKYDLQLPRDHPELHVQGNEKEQGPNPEVVLIAPKSDTVILTLDLYGGIAFAKLSSALDGKLEKLQYVSSALDGSWGKSFPDRASLFEVGGKEYLLVSNASPDGGLALFDVANRKVIQKFEAASGCETPILLQASSRLVTSVSGKIKSRDAGKVEKSSSPENDLLVFDVASLADGREAKVERIAFDKPVMLVESINPLKNDLLLLVLGDTESEILVYDLAARKILHREPAKGKISRIAVGNARSTPDVASSHP